LEELTSSHLEQDSEELEPELLDVDDDVLELQLDDSVVLFVELSEYVCSEEEDDEVEDELEEKEDGKEDEEEELFEELDDELLEVLLQLSLQEEPALIPVTEIKEQESLFSQL